MGGLKRRLRKEHYPALGPEGHLISNLHYLSHFSARSIPWGGVGMGIWMWRGIVRGWGWGWSASCKLQTLLEKSLLLDFLSNSSFLDVEHTQ